MVISGRLIVHVPYKQHSAGQGEPGQHPPPSVVRAARESINDIISAIAGAEHEMRAAMVRARIYINRMIIAVMHGFVLA